MEVDGDNSTLRRLKKTYNRKSRLKQTDTNAIVIQTEDDLKESIKVGNVFVIKETVENQQSKRPNQTIRTGNTNEIPTIENQNTNRQIITQENYNRPRPTTVMENPIKIKVEEDVTTAFLVAEEKRVTHNSIMQRNKFMSIPENLNNSLATTGSVIQNSKLWRKGGRSLIHDGYTYHVQSIAPNGKRYMSCKYSRKNLCKSRGILYPDGTFTVTTKHNHPPEQNTVDVALFRRQLKEGVMQSLRPIKVIYDELSLLNPAGSAELPLKIINDSLRRMRVQQMTRLQPDTLTDLCAQLGSDNWRHLVDCSAGRLYSGGPSVDEDGAVSLVLGSREFVAELGDVRAVYLDIVYRILPEKPTMKQLLVFMYDRDDHIIPFAYALMERSTMSSYHSVLSHVRNCLAPNIRPDIIYCNYELPLQQAISQVYVDADIRGCYNYFIKAIECKARELGISENVTCLSPGVKTISGLCSLPLLPAGLIPAGLGQIREHCPPPLLATFDPLFSYVQEFWLEKVSPEVFSVFGELGRVNIKIELFHKKFCHMFAHEKIYISTLIKVIVDQQENLMLKYIVGQSELGKDKFKKFSVHSTKSFNKKIMSWWKSMKEDAQTVWLSVEQIAPLIEAEVQSAFYNADDPTVKRVWQT